MNRTLRMAVAFFFAITISVAPGHAQLDDTSSTSGSTGSASTQGTSSPDANQPASAQSTSGPGANQPASTADTSNVDDGQTASTPGMSDLGTGQSASAIASGTSSWTAGAGSFKGASGTIWVGRQSSATFGQTGAKTWTAESSSFAKPVQPGGIWRDNAPVSMSAVPASVESTHSTAFVATPMTHSGSTSAHAASAGARHVKPFPSAARHGHGAAHKSRRPAPPVPESAPKREPNVLHDSMELNPH